LVSTLRSRLLAGGVVAGFLAVTLIPSFSVAAPPLDIAEQAGRSDVVAWLVEKGATRGKKSV
jgi:hypothetical protein